MQCERSLTGLQLPESGITDLIVATLALIVFQAIQTGAGGVNIAAVVIVCFGIDVFRQFQQVSLNTIVFAIEPAARSRMNAILQIAVRPCLTETRPQLVAGPAC